MPRLAVSGPVSIMKSGMLLKKSDHIRKWNRRFFELRASPGQHGVTRWAPFRLLGS